MRIKQSAKLRDQFGAFKVWEVSRGSLSEFQVRQGNKILIRYAHLFNAMNDAKLRNEKEWTAIGSLIFKMGNEP